MRWIASVLLITGAALGGTTDDSIPDAKYLEYGKTFAGCTRQLSVVEVSGKLALGSAVAIDKHWALTAAHVVDGVVAASVGKHRVSMIFVHPDYRDGVFGFADIALLRTDEDLGAEYYPPMSDGRETEGDVVAFAGYGVTGRLSVGHERSDGALRAGTNKISRFERTILVCPARRGGSPLPFCIAPGDSGGPVFVGSGKNSRLCGIASFVMGDKPPNRSRVGEEMGATRVSLFRSWIDHARKMAP